VIRKNGEFFNFVSCPSLQRQNEAGQHGKTIRLCQILSKRRVQQLRKNCYAIGSDAGYWSIGYPHLHENMRAVQRYALAQKGLGRNDLNHARLLL
jgi:hypothetical protein